MSVAFATGDLVPDGRGAAANEATDQRPLLAFGHATHDGTRSRGARNDRHALFG